MMTTRRFASRGEAERFLAAEGFRFLGAPSRWRRQDADAVRYADVVPRNGAAVIIFTEARCAPQPVRQTAAQAG